MKWKRRLEFNRSFGWIWKHFKDLNKNVEIFDEAAEASRMKVWEEELIIDHSTDKYDRNFFGKELLLYKQSDRVENWS